MAKEKVAFELERPNANTPVTRTNAINHGDKPLDQCIEGRDTKVNSNSGSVEAKVNALIDCAITIIQNVPFYGGVPYKIPQQLLSRLQLLRIGDISSTPAVCGQAMCGQTICGTN